MSTLVAFDTSGAYCAAAVFRDGTVIAAQHEEMARGQAERLFPMLEEVLREANVTWSDLDAIGVGIGPGNFTGIRISVSAARGLALSLGVPAVGVTLFDALKERGPEGPFVLTLSGPRDRIYVMRSASSDIETTTLEDFPECAPETTVVGHRSQEISERLGCDHAPAYFAPAAAVAHIAARRWQDDPPRPAPFYLRPADAAPSSDPPPVILP